jgi:hypothetical protein
MHGRTPTYHEMSSAMATALNPGNHNTGLITSKWTMVINRNKNKSLMKQFVITHIIHQTEIPALPDSWVKSDLNFFAFSKSKRLQDHWI